MKFLGIDLGWSSGASGLCYLEWSNKFIHLLDLDRQLSIKNILNWVGKWTSPTQTALIAVDASTLIPKLTRMSLPNQLTYKYFRQDHTGCYPTNLERPFAQSTVEFGLSLEAQGFTHNPLITTQALGRYQIEVYTHPTSMHLFSLNHILKYKKCSLAEPR